MLRRKSSCFGLALLLLYGAFGNSLGQEADLIDSTTNVTTEPILPTDLSNATTSEPPTTVTTTTEAATTVTTPGTTISTTTTEVPVTTTAVPIPDLGPYTWTVYDAITNTTCIVLKLQPEIFVPYVNASMQEMRANITVPSNATAVGSCSDAISTTPQSITLSWPSSAGLFLPPHTLTLSFAKNNSEGQDYVFSLASVSMLIQPDVDYFPNITTVDSIEAHNYTLNLHPTHANNSYRCNAAETIDMVSNHTTLLPVQVVLRNMQVEAFRSRADNQFSRAVDCPADAVLSSDIVPIAVGCALAALVVVVLIAYLIGRRRARQRGYQSV